VPLPNNSLRYVFVCLFETERAADLVDAGWNTEDAYAALAAGLDVAGYAIGDVRGVLVTHIHPDHYGLAGRIREAAGAWVALHPADAALVRDRYAEPTDLLGAGGHDVAPGRGAGQRDRDVAAGGDASAAVRRRGHAGAAVGEALAHLRALEHRGVVREEPGEPSHWVVTDEAGERVDALGALSAAEAASAG
jgi:Metallo-beta-lactamase superfamily